jgi:heme A synthase
VLAVVGVVIAAAILTQVIPGAAEVLYDTPLAIGVLLVGTGWWLWRISRHGPDAPDR